MSKPLVSDELWAIVAPLLPTDPPKPKGGRPRRISDRAALTGILFVLGLRQRDDLLAAAAGLAEGREGSGGNCIGCSCNVCRTRDESTGSGPHSIVRVCRLPG